MDAMITTAALAGAEKIINAALDYDPATKRALAQLAPHILSVEITLPELRVYIAPTQEGVRLLGHCEDPVTTQLRGSAAALLGLLTSNTMNLKDSGVEVNGSLHFLSELQRILKHLDIDWEEMLSQVFGDVLGHEAANLGRAQGHWASERLSTAQRLTAEFITEELRLLPSKPELDYFYQAVDNLRLDVDRIEARIEQLIARRHAANSPQES